MFSARWSLPLLISLMLGAAPAARGETERPLPAAANGSVAQQIVSDFGDASVLILGEHHREPESHALFLSLVKAFVARGERVTVGLEISSDRQGELAAALQGLRSCGGVAVHPIECSSYDLMLHSLGELARRPGSLVKVLAIDARPRPGADRDEAMAARVEESLRQDPGRRVLVLAGNLHALKEIPWAPGLPPRKKLAALLTAKGVKVASLIQRFGKQCAETPVGRLELPGTGPATAAVTNLWSCLRTEPDPGPKLASLAVDGVVSWSCAN